MYRTLVFVKFVFHTHTTEWRHERRNSLRSWDLRIFHKKVFFHSITSILCAGHFARFLRFGTKTYRNGVRFMNTRLISTGICQRGSAEKSDNKTRMEKSRLLRDYFWETLLREKKLKWASVPAITPTWILRSAEVELRGISGKGIGIFAKKSIDRGTIFGYGGVHVCSDYFRANQKRLSRVS